MDGGCWVTTVMMMTMMMMMATNAVLRDKPVKLIS